MSLIELSLALVILGLTALGSISLAGLYSDNMKSTAAGQEMAVFSAGVKAFMKDNYYNLKAATAPGPPAVITPGALTFISTENPTGDKYVPADFPKKNSYGQHYYALVRGTVVGTGTMLNALALTAGGAALNDIDLAQLAGVISSAGISGGGIYAADPTQARGISGAWSVPISSFPMTNISVPGVGLVPAYAPGHPAVSLSLEDTNPAGSYLYRNTVSGLLSPLPLNTMSTTLDMQGNDITTTGTISGAAVTAGTLSLSGKASFSSAQLTSVVSEDTACGSNGLLARNSAGQIVSCQSGTWSAVKVEPPSYKRVSFYANGSWVVPAGVKIVWITMAGGGGTAQGWRVTNFIVPGHAGGYVSNYPLSVTPGEIIAVTVGAAGALAVTPGDPNTDYYAPKCDGVSDGPVALSANAEGTGELKGFTGGLSKIASNLRPSIMSCAGGNAAGPGQLMSVSTQSYVSANSVPTPNNTYGYDDIGVNNAPYFPGSFVVSVSHYYASCTVSGSGAITRQNTQGIRFASGFYPGEQTPMGYGSGGGAYATDTKRVWASPATVGRCIQPLPARDGVVHIDYAE